MNTLRRIAIVTGTRAEYGLLRPVIRAIREHPQLEPQLIVTGMHLITDSLRDIHADGFEIHATVPMQETGAVGRSADVTALARGVEGLGKVFAEQPPEVVLVLGDRIEALAAALAGAVGGIRVAHIHGGDRAEGVADEAMRHAISKLAHLHFPATEQSRQRLLKLGEAPDTVFNVGSPAMDNLHAITPAADAADLIVMQHPVGESDEQEKQWMLQTLAATAAWSRTVLAPNADPGSLGIRAALAEANVNVVEHLPREAFLSRLKAAKAIVGNSSAGLIEAAALGTACVNIGPRQGGREKPPSVIDCHYGQAHVQNALQQALSFAPASFEHPYGDGHTGSRIAEKLANVPLNEMPIRKQNTY